MWAILVATVVAAAPQQADPSRKALETCRISGVSFRTAQDGWLFDHCGRIFRSSDGGDGWVRSPALEKTILGAEGSTGFGVKHVVRLTWLTATVGLAFPYDEPFAARTDDGGATWTKVPAAIDGYVYGAEVVGSHVWFCDSSGHVKMSPDLGEHWSRNRQLFEAAAVNPTNWCSAISFIDAKSGWVLGWKSLWQTVDGGESWTELTPPVSATARLEHLVRLTPSVAWIAAGDGTRFVTMDGGRTWNQKGSAQTVSLRTRTDGRPLLSATGASVVELEPSFELPDDQLDSRWALSLPLLEKLRTAREPPVLSPATPQRVTLTHIAGQWAASNTTVFRARSDGVWFVAGALKSPVTRLVALESGSWIAQTNDGLFRDGKPASSADRMDWERLTGSDGRSATQRSFDCLQKNEGWLSIEVTSQGCFYSETSFIRVTLEARVARVTASSIAVGGSGKPLSVARKWIERVSAAATRPEVPSSCWSTENRIVALKWQCAGQSEQELQFESSSCGSSSETRTQSGRDDGYARALGVIEVAESLFAVTDAGVK